MVAIAQNSALWSLSIVDFGAGRQHYCKGSEELAIPETASLGLAGQVSSSEFFREYQASWKPHQEA